MERDDIYNKITNIIIERLKSGEIPWEKPWSNKTQITPQNYVSGKHYNGINELILMSRRDEHPLYLTFNQAKELGGSIKKGAKSSIVVFWKPLHIDKLTGKIVNNKADYKKDDKIIPYLKYFNVFNIKDTEGFEKKLPEIIQISEKEKIEACEKIINEMPDRPQIIEQGNIASYSHTHDIVSVPPREQFKNIHEFYSTAFHELIHSTGHSKRLDRKLDNFFGTKPYAKEELIAELGSSFLCGKTGIETKTIENSAAYIQGWLKELSSDPKFVFEAATKAQKAADYIQGLSIELDKSLDFTKSKAMGM